MPYLEPGDLNPVEEAPELLADAFVADDDGLLVFSSFWGRDTAVQQLLANLTLSPDEGGLTSLTLGDPHRQRLFVANRDHYEKRSTRTRRRTCFGELVNLWLLHRRCIAPDRVNRRAYVLFTREMGTLERGQLLWRRIQDLSPYPLLDSWQRPVMKVLRDHNAIHGLTNTSPTVSAVRLDLSSHEVEAEISLLISSGALGIH
ncbi:hypothetical protein [Carnimonas bestiolae]|uniref:hypothetical protein n=1 Tax=Carnimonas bestiolae TaxID=3402172 RepID=UPI003EDC3C77